VVPVGGTLAVEGAAVGDADAIVTGAADRTSGKLDKKLTLSAGEVTGAALAIVAVAVGVLKDGVLASVVLPGVTPTAAIAKRVDCELAALA
jgi:hypothetical protein